MSSLATFQLGEVLWTMLVFFGFIVWFWLLIIIFGDIFRSHDMGGFAKALWIIFVIFLPFLGILVYLIARGGSMQERQIEAAKQADAQFREYVQQSAGTSAADQLAKLGALHDKGQLTDAEFAAEKAKVLAG